MPLVLNGAGTIGGLSAGGLPDGSITADELASSAVTTAKVNDAAITFAKLSTSATESDNVAKRTAKAWVNFNGTGVVEIRDDFNVSSITDNSAAQYTVNFSSAFSDTNYCVVFGSAQDTTTGAVVHEMGIRTTNGTAVNIGTSTLAILTKGQDGTLYDALYVHLAIFGS